MTMPLGSLLTPALLLDQDILERNLQRMQQRANLLGVSLRPHMKTHKCLEIGKRQRELGAKGITVSTFYEAEKFADAGFDDITWAFPIPPVYATKAADLASRITFRVVIDSLAAKGHLDKAARVSERKLHVWLKIDCGNHRAGVDPRSPEAEELIRKLNESSVLEFDGILSHSGHAYAGRNPDEILDAARQERDVMVDLAGRMRAKGLRVPGISVGSTPAMAVIDRLDGVTEARPGNYVFYDYTMATLGICGVEDCAVTVLASVISHRPHARHFLTDAGALALSKDLGPAHVPNPMDMGPIYEDYNRKRLFAHIHMGSLSQEHGKVVTDGGMALDGMFSVGERVRILENHSCLTVAHFDEYVVIQDDEPVQRWQILKGRSV